LRATEEAVKIAEVKVKIASDSNAKSIGDAKAVEAKFQKQ